MYCFFQQARAVPKYLLDMSAHFGCTHVSIPSIWVKWGQMAGNTPSPSKDAHTTGNEAFLHSATTADEEVGFSLLDDDALARVGQQKASLTAVYDASSAAVAQKVKGILADLFPRMFTFFYCFI